MAKDNPVLYRKTRMMLASLLSMPNDSAEEEMLPVVRAPVRVNQLNSKNMSILAVQAASRKKRRRDKAQCKLCKHHGVVSSDGHRTGSKCPFFKSDLDLVQDVPNSSAL